MSIQPINLQATKPSVLPSVAPVATNTNKPADTQAPKKNLAPWKYALASFAVNGAGQFAQGRKDDAINHLSNMVLFSLVGIPACIPTPMNRATIITKVAFGILAALGVLGTKIHSAVDAYKGAKKLNEIA